jgi:hypothetical protein
MGSFGYRLIHFFFLLCGSLLYLLPSVGSRRPCLTWLHSRLPLMRLHKRISNLIRLRCQLREREISTF